MGLAASQARFLAITSRKTNCEFQSMQIAQEKLSITRDLQKASDQYQAALNKSKLVWDPDGSGTNAYDLSYDIMMRPSAVNNYTPYLITTKDGRVVLDSKMAAAARQAGIPENGLKDKTIVLDDGTTTTTYKQAYAKFINQMVKTGGMSETSAVSCRTIGLLEDVGTGAPLLDKTTASEMNINDLIAYIDTTIANGQYGTDGQKELAEALTFGFAKDADGNSTLDLKLDLSNKGDANSDYFVYNNQKTTNTEFTLSDLLTDDITFAMTGNANSTKWWKKALAFICSLPTLGIAYNGLKDVFGVTEGGYPEGCETAEDKAMFDFLDSMIDGFAKLLKVDKDDPESCAAFDYAVKETFSLLSQNTDLGSRNHSTDAFNDAIKGANEHNGWVTKDAAKDKEYGTQAISLSNLAESFMTFYAQGLNGYDESYYIKPSSKKSSYVTDDTTYLWKVGNPDANTAQEMYVAEFYSSMFNNICQNGWVENDQINDEEYLSHGMKNAQFFISSLSNDNYYYQDRYTDCGYVMEVTDEDAITQAELEYTNKKSKLNYKEQQLEVDMKRLDLEISALTTEYDTVKNLISKNVEKTFTMFNS